MFIQGKKIDLRGLEKDDLQHIKRWLNDPEVTKYMIMGWRPSYVEVLLEKWDAEIQNPQNISFSICEKQSGKIVGWCGLYVINAITQAAEFRVFIGETEYWNQGFAAEAGTLLLKYAFSRLNLNKVFLGVNASYAQAVRCYEKIGFVKEGVLRQEIFTSGSYHDAVRMSVLREEYEQ